MARLSRTLLVVLLVATGCGGDGETGTAATTTSQAPATTEPQRQAECSAAGMSSEPEEQPGLPAPVAQMRRQIVAAAGACDLQRLEELALAGDGGFTYSFGADGDPAGYWLRQEEVEGERDPLRLLVGLLDRPHAVIGNEDGGEAHYAWPSAFGYDRWEVVPDEEKELLKPLYTEEDFESFDLFGSYAGYRVGITASGDWIFFVAGD